MALTFTQVMNLVNASKDKLIIVCIADGKIVARICIDELPAYLITALIDCQKEPGRSWEFEVQEGK